MRLKTETFSGEKIMSLNITKECSRVLTQIRGIKGNLTEKQKIRKIVGFLKRRGFSAKLSPGQMKQIAGKLYDGKIDKIDLTKIWDKNPDRRKNGSVILGKDTWVGKVAAKFHELTKVKPHAGSPILSRSRNNPHPDEADCDEGVHCEKGQYLWNAL